MPSECHMMQNDSWEGEPCCPESPYLGDLVESGVGQVRLPHEPVMLK